jgi:hypothetical protein
MADQIPSGYQFAGRITTGFDGGNHPVKGDIWSCRSCGQLILPRDAGIHEDAHTKTDQLNLAIRLLLQAELAYGHQHTSHDPDGEKGRTWLRAMNEALQTMGIPMSVLQIPG